MVTTVTLLSSLGGVIVVAIILLFREVIKLRERVARLEERTK